MFGLWFSTSVIFFLFYRIERLWRDVFSAVTGRFNDVLHDLEEEGHLDLSISLHIFCYHYAFLPLIQHQLNIFKFGWDDHPISTEENLSPNQLWHLGQQYHFQGYDDVSFFSQQKLIELYRTCQKGFYNFILKDLHIPQIDWESSGLICSEPNCGVQVPELEFSLTPILKHYNVWLLGFFKHRRFLVSFLYSTDFQDWCLYKMFICRMLLQHRVIDFNERKRF